MILCKNCRDNSTLGENRSIKFVVEEFHRPAQDLFQMPLRKTETLTVSLGRSHPLNLESNICTQFEFHC